MQYQVKWGGIIKVSFISSSVLVVFIALNFALLENTFFDIFVILVFLIWIYVHSIILFSASSYLSIDKGVVSHKVLGMKIYEYKIPELLSYTEELGLYPGILTFKNGSKFSISGLAIGRENELIKFLKLQNHDIEINIRY